jgi:hypothetical protein
MNDHEKLNDSIMRKGIAASMLLLASAQEREAFHSLQEAPAATLPEGTTYGLYDGVKFRSFQLHGDPGFGFFYGYFQGVGSLLVYATREHGVMAWVDPLAGDGLASRKAYLESFLLSDIRGRKIVVMNRETPGDN